MLAVCTLVLAIVSWRPWVPPIPSAFLIADRKPPSRPAGKRAPPAPGCAAHGAVPSRGSSNHATRIVLRYWPGLPV